MFLRVLTGKSLFGQRRMMEIENYIELLKQDKSISAYTCMSKDEEIKYMEGQKYRLEKLIRRLEEVIKSLSMSCKPVRVLDIGTTPFTILIKQKFENCEFWGMDRTNHLENRLQQVGIGFKTCDLDNEPIPFEDEYFDLVIFTEVLEHIFAPPTGIVTEIKRIIRPSGKLILSVPNIATLSKRVKFLFGITPLDDANDQMKKWLHGHGHIHEYTKKEIFSLCKSINFKISYAEMLSTNPMDLLREKGKCSLKGFLCSCIAFLVPQFRRVIYVECDK